jgi:hypothetical protein
LLTVGPASRPEILEVLTPLDADAHHPCVLARALRAGGSDAAEDAPRPLLKRPLK